MGRCYIIYVLFLGFVAVLNTANGVDVDFSYYKPCYSKGDNMELKAVYTGNGSVTAVEWYYSGKDNSNLIIIASTCRMFGALDAGYPDESRMSFICFPTMNLFTITVAGLLSDELDKSWGATFHLFAGLSPPVVKQPIIYCIYGTTTPTKTISTWHHDTTTPAKTISTWDHGPFTTLFPGTLQQIHIKDNKVPVKGGEVQIVCDIVHFSDADTVRVYKTDSILTSDITTAQSLASCNPTRCFGTEPRHTFSSSYSGVIITITYLHSSDDQKYWTCVMNNQQISMQLTVYYSRSDIYTSTTETSYTMSIVLGAVCFVVLIYAIGLTILYKRKTKNEGSASNSANGTYANENLGNISDATVAQHFENEATVLPSPQYTELAHYTNERTTYERLQN